jgi:F-type H+-transporting ATPase subunit a
MKRDLGTHNKHPLSSFRRFFGLHSAIRSSTYSRYVSLLITEFTSNIRRTVRRGLSMMRSNKLSYVSIPLAAEPIFEIGNFTVTNALLNSYIAVAFFLVIAFIASRRKKLVPEGIHNFFEAIIELALAEIDKVTEDKKKTRIFFPLVATIFFFVLFSNWLGLLPGTGSIGIYGYLHGHFELIPLLRPATSDLNLTLAIAALSILMTHIAGIAYTGFGNHFSKFINFRGIFRSLKKGPMAIVVACVEFGIGLIEIVGEFAKTLSLSLRLFGNVFAGEVLLTVMMSLLAIALPIPFIFLEILVGLIQATVFAMLTLAFLVVSTMSHGHDDEEHNEELEASPAH